MEMLRFLVLFLATLYFCDTRLSRHRRHRKYHDESSSELAIPNPHRIQTPPCDLLCNAQWKSDFQINFGANYDSSYFDVPLDYVILGSKQSLISFCSITQQKFTCYTRECEMEKIPWSAERHICHDEMESFQRNVNCMAKTSRIVRKECTDICNNITPKLSQQEAIFLKSMRLSQMEHDAFVEQNFNCHFTACHQICHELTVIQKCEQDDQERSREMIKSYYDAFMFNDWKEIQETHNEKLFSSFCRRITKGLNENSYVLNMTRYNNQQLERIKFEVKQMLSVV